MTRRCNYTVQSDGEVIARFAMFTDIEFFMQKAKEIDLFGKTGAVAYKPNGEFISECKPTHSKETAMTSDSNRPSSMGKPLSALNIKYSLRPASTGGYLPYPIYLDPELFVIGHRSPPPDKLIGFQRGSVQSLVLDTVDFAADPTKAEGLTPVFSNGDGFYSIDFTADSVTVY